MPKKSVNSIILLLGLGSQDGPAAKEAGHAFQITKHNPDPYAGAAIKPGDTNISGVAVGASGAAAQAIQAERRPAPLPSRMEPVQTGPHKF
jgi:hypothetical protein